MGTSKITQSLVQHGIELKEYGVMVEIKDRVGSGLKFSTTTARVTAVTAVI